MFVPFCRETSSQRESGLTQVNMSGTQLKMQSFKLRVDNDVMYR